MAAAGNDAAESVWAELVEEWLQRPGVTSKRMMASPTLMVGGSIFAMHVRGELVVKVPPGQAEQLVAAGDARPFEPRPGRFMNLWVVLQTPPAFGAWDAIAAEAFAYVGSLPPKKKRVRG